MSQRVVRYEGEGRARRPIRIDEGPASARLERDIGPGKATLGVGIPDRDLSGGAGQVERRFITEAERVARAEVRASAIPDVTRRPTRGRSTPDQLQVSRLNGARRHVEVIAAQRSAATAIQEEPMDAMPPVEPLPPIVNDAPATELEDPLVALSRASLDAAEARASLAAAELAWSIARRALEDAMAACGALIDPRPADTAPEAEPPPPPRPATRPARPARPPRDREVGAPIARAPERAPAPPAKALSATQQRVLEAALRHNGDQRAVATELGFNNYQQVTSTLLAIGKKGLLPINLITKLPAQFARFQGA